MLERLEPALALGPAPKPLRLTPAPARSRQLAVGLAKQEPARLQPGQLEPLVDSAERRPRRGEQQPPGRGVGMRASPTAISASSRRMDKDIGTSVPRQASGLIART